MEIYNTDKKPIIIGVTGGIGSGKSSVCKAFEALGVPVYNADENAKILTNSSESIRQKLIALFGSDIYFENGLNKTKLAKIIFNDKAALEKVNSIVHPVVNMHFKQWIAANSNYKILIKEAAILIESGSYKNVDVVITVSTNIDERVRRVLSRDRLNEKDVMARINNQITDFERERYADFVIYNNDNNQILPTILDIYRRFQ